MQPQPRAVMGQPRSRGFRWLRTGTPSRPQPTGRCQATVHLASHRRSHRLRLRPLSLPPTTGEEAEGTEGGGGGVGKSNTGAGPWSYLPGVVL